MALLNTSDGTAAGMRPLPDWPGPAGPDFRSGEAGSALVSSAFSTSGAPGDDTATLVDMEKIDILLVDDMPEKLLSLEVVLSSLEQNVVKATSGREALRLILKRNFAVIVLDINMPGIDGFEAAALIRQRPTSAHTPIIFVTSFSTSDAEIYRGYSLGAVDYLFAPIIPEVLRSKVSVFIELARKSRQLQRQAEALRRADEERLTRQLTETNTRLEWETRRNHFFRLSIELLGIADYWGVLAQTNPTWATTLGYSEEELRGHSLFEFVHPDDQAATRETLAGITEALEPRFFENRFRHRNGTYRWLAWTIAPFAAEGLLYIFARDNTERREREDEVRALNENLKKQAVILQTLNEELESFSYSLSHDLRAPLRAISSYSEMLIAGEAGELPPDALQILRGVNGNGMHMLQLIDDFLNFFRFGRGEVEPAAIDMETMARETIATLPPPAGKRAVEFKVAALPSARGDTAMVAQIFANLVSNAVKFSGRRAKARVEIGCVAKSRPPVYFVKDNGVGFNMEHYNKLFGVFQRLHADTDFAGTGIGLAIVRRIVQRHGGRVWAEAKINGGATFFFTLAPSRSD